MAAAKLAERKKYWLNFCRQIQRVPCMWVMDVAVLLEPLFPICLMRWGSRLTVSIMLMMPADRWIFSRRAFGFDIWHCAEKQSYFRRMLIGVNMLSVSPRPYSISMTDIFMFPQIRFLKIFRLMNRRAKALLGDKYEPVFILGLDNVLADIRDDLAEFGVHYDNWFSERQFISTDVVDKLLDKLKESGHVYEQDNGLWFKSTEFGDEKDRVLVRSNGQRTYFANDVAYHLSKFERGFDIAIDIFGADHHGYVPRMKAAMEASGINPERLVHLLLQFVTLYRGGSQVQMSTRSGTFVTLRELREEVGNDAARFFYVMRKGEQHIDFDLDLAKAQSNENPVYYVQYAFARICSVFKQLAERNLSYDEANGLSHLSLLSQPHERQLLNTISRYPDMIVNAALHYEPHQLTNYLRDLAADFHAYYNSHQFLVEDTGLRNARLALVTATRQTLLNGFNLLGISAPESM